VTTARKLPPHGTEYRYRGPVDGSWPGCRCPKCTQAQARAGKVRALARLRGEDALHPAEPVVEHIKTLQASGMSYACIARQAGVANNTVTYLARGLSKKCRRDRALRILAVKPAEFDTRADRPAFMAIRRLRALYAIGHNPATIGAAANLDPSTISHVANGRYETVEATTDLGVRRAYAKLCTVAGSSAKAKKRAAALGWHGPLDWDDIDDPAAKPETSRKSRAQSSAKPKVYADPARVAELTRAGRTAQQIADELGCHKRTVVRARGKGEMATAA
jgi:DNA-binding CsgD family transcriptional regulator